MYSAVDASSRASGALKTTNKTPRLPSAVSGGNKAPWGLGTPYGAKSAPPREWYPTSVLDFRPAGLVDLARGMGMGVGRGRHAACRQGALEVEVTTDSPLGAGSGIWQAGSI